MTDQEKVTRFSDGEPLHPFGKPKHFWRTLGEITLTWTIVFGVLIGAFWWLFSIVGERHAHAETAMGEVQRVDDPTRESTFRDPTVTPTREPRDPSVMIYEKPGECFIDIELGVTGAKRTACVDRLETAARLAKYEQIVNKGRRKK